MERSVEVRVIGVFTLVSSAVFLLIGVAGILGLFCRPLPPGLITAMCPPGGCPASPCPAPYDYPAYFLLLGAGGCLLVFRAVLLGATDILMQYAILAACWTVAVWGFDLLLGDGGLGFLLGSGVWLASVTFALAYKGGRLRNRFFFPRAGARSAKTR